LCNAFLSAVGRNEPEKGIVFISSGAGRNPYDGWAPYCSSKAGLDMLARCITEEQKRNNRNVKVFSVAPGVIDTEMQQEIRDASIENFSYAERFRNLKIDNQLESPQACAKKLLCMWLNRQMFDDVCLDLRKLNLD
jgi:benzil reductase ((S)-benzoin forming)